MYYLNEEQKTEYRLDSSSSYTEDLDALKATWNSAHTPIEVVLDSPPIYIMVFLQNSHWMNQIKLY